MLPTWKKHRLKSVYFCRCSGCQQEWRTRETFLRDGATHLSGYQVNFVELEAGWFLFNHHRAACQTTFALPANLFFDLCDSPRFSERRTGMEECPKYCLNPECLEPCTAACECAWVRDTIQVIKEQKNVQVAAQDSRE